MCAIVFACMPAFILFSTKEVVTACTDFLLIKQAFSCCQASDKITHSWLSVHFVSFIPISRMPEVKARSRWLTFALASCNLLCALTLALFTHYGFSGFTWYMFSRLLGINRTFLFVLFFFFLSDRDYSVTALEEIGLSVILVKGDGLYYCLRRLVLKSKSTIIFSTSIYIRSRRL